MSGRWINNVGQFVPTRSVAIGLGAHATEDGQVVIQSDSGGYIIVGHDGIDIGIDREHQADQKYQDRPGGHIVIDGMDMRKLFADIENLREQMHALQPLVHYARNQAAQKIQRAWRRYMYAPVTGKWYRVARDDYRERVKSHV